MRNGDEKSYRTFEIYENHKRKYLQWGPTKPQERPVWSDQNGQLRTKDEIDTLIKEMDCWEWQGDWAVDTSNMELAEEGWEFASAWSKFGMRAARDWANAGDIVRRRKWIRTMRKQAPAGKTHVGTPQASLDHMVHNIVRAIKILSGTNKDINGFVKRIGTEKDSHSNRHNFEEVFCTTNARLNEVERELEIIEEDGGVLMRGTVSKLMKDLKEVKKALQSSKENYDLKVRNYPLHSASEDFDSSYDSTKERPMSAAAKEALPNATNVQQRYSFTEHEHSQYPGESLDPESQKIDAQLRAIDEIEINEAIMLEREQEIIKINKDLLQVHEISQDLHGMVEGQQAGIDEITKNVTETEDRTETGLQEMHQAEKSQKAACVIS